MSAPIHEVQGRKFKELPAIDRGCRGCDARDVPDLCDAMPDCALDEDGEISFKRFKEVKE